MKNEEAFLDFLQFKGEQRNKAVFKHRLCFLTAILYLIFIPRKTLLQIRFAQDCMAINAESCQLPDMLQGYYNKLVQIEKDFVRYGHKSCSAGILLECANIHK